MILYTIEILNEEVTYPNIERKKNKHYENKYSMYFG
jgi:hypothetical protein